MAVAPMPPALVAANDALEPYLYGAGNDAAAMPVGAVEAWARAAVPGTKVIYARGYLPRWAKGPIAVRAYAARGLVALTQGRDAQGVIEYWAERTAAPFEAPARSITPSRPSRAEHEEQLLDLIVEVAEAGEPMPTNFEVARRLDFADGNRVKYLLHCLEKAKVIARSASEWVPGRIVTVIATGAATTVIEGLPG